MWFGIKALVLLSNEGGGMQAIEALRTLGAVNEDLVRRARIPKA